MRRYRFLISLIALTLCVGFAQPASAQLAGRSTEEWLKTLENPTRIAGLKVDETVTKLGLKPGAIVADIGAGAGIFEASLAQAVSPGGKVYAVDIDKGLIDHIAERAAERHITNVQGVVGTFTDPKLPVRNVDLAFIYDVLHHIEARAEYLKNLAGYLKPSGRIAVIDFRPGQGGHRDLPELQVAREQATAWMAAAGLKPVEEIELFTDKWFVIYGK